jgi:hypothetical protein
VAREPGEIGAAVVGDDHVQVVVGVRSHHAVVGLRPFEDEADHGWFSGSEFDKGVVGEGLLSSHGVDLR